MAGGKEPEKKKVKAGNSYGAGSAGNAPGYGVFFIQLVDTIQPYEFY